MKLVFLDVDGVLNDHTFNTLSLCGPIHADKIRLLNELCFRTGAKLVLSSAWRYIIHRGEATIEGIDWLLRSHGLQAGRLIGYTRPDTKVQPYWDGTSQIWHHTDERGLQIQDWLRQFDEGRAEKSRAVALDDMDLGITMAGLPFVQTDGTVGLTKADVEKAVKLLNAHR